MAWTKVVARLTTLPKKSVAGEQMQATTRWAMKTIHLARVSTTGSGGDGGGHVGGGG